MCGLVGAIYKWSNGLNRDMMDAFTNLLFIDQLRGDDSTGVFCVTNDGDVFGAKSTDRSSVFINTKEYDQFQQRAIRQGAAVIGHNRKATKGNIVDENAHPFVVDDNIVLVHNGTMYSDHKKLANVDVDSHAIAHLIHEKGDVAKALSSFNGAYALIWYDVREGTVHMVRNNARPLWWMEINEGWLWASEPEMLDFVARREDLKVKGEISQLPVDVLQTYRLKSTRGWDVSNKELKVTSPPSEPYYPSTSCMMGPSNRMYEAEEEWERWRFGQRGTGGSHGQGIFPPEIRRSGTQTTNGTKSSPETRNSALGVVPAKEPEESNSVHEDERRMCKDSNRTCTHKEWLAVLGQYPYNTTVQCEPFDFHYVNGRDGANGYYLYATPFGDQGVVIRHHFPANVVTEDRMLQLATGNYLYEMTIGKRRWAPLDVPFGTPIEGDLENTPGYAIFVSTHAQMLYDHTSDTAH